MKKLFVITILLSSLVLSMACKKSSTNPVGYEIGKTRGCGDFVLHQILEKDLIVSIQLDNAKQKFSTDWQTIEVTEASFSSGVSSALTQTSNLKASWNNQCNDVLEDEGTTTPWNLVKGKIRFKVDKVFITYGCINSYKATLILENADFRLGKSTQIKHFDTIEFKEVMVGWCAG
jgi:hypothetical protein